MKFFAITSVAAAICTNFVGAELYEVSFGIRPPLDDRPPNHDLNFGQSVSISRDGNYTVVGIPNKEESGRVCVYKNEKMKSRDFDNEMECVDAWDVRVGRRDGVAISGDAKIIALSDFNFRPAENKESWKLSKIKVFVRKESEDGWWFEQLGEDITSPCLEKEDGGEMKYKGCMKILPKSLAVSADGSTVAVMFNDRQKGRNRFVIRAYRFNGKKWVHRGNAIKPKYETMGDLAERFQFPRLSLSANGRVIAIGYERALQVEDSTKYSYGRVYVLDSFGIWKPRRGFVDLSNDEEDGRIRFPMIQISDDGLTVAIGGDDMHDFHAEEAFGLVKVYRFMNDGPFTQKKWKMIGEPITFSTKHSYNGPIDMYSATKRQYAFFSMDLSGDGSTIAVGAPEDMMHQSDTQKFGGKVTVYRINEETEQWEGVEIMDEEFLDFKENTLVGMDVSLSYDGSMLAAGVPGYMGAKTGDWSNDWGNGEDHDEEDHDWWDEDHEDHDEEDHGDTYGYDEDHDEEDHDEQDHDWDQDHEEDHGDTYGYDEDHDEEDHDWDQDHEDHDEEDHDWDQDHEDHDEEDHNWDEEDHDEDHGDNYGYDEDHDEEDHDWEEDHDEEEDEEWDPFQGYIEQNREGRVRVFELRNEFKAPFETAVE